MTDVRFHRRGDPSRYREHVTEVRVDSVYVSGLKLIDGHADAGGGPVRVYHLRGDVDLIDGLTVDEWEGQRS